MNRICGYPLSEGGFCRHPLADLQRSQCGRHSGDEPCVEVPFRLPPEQREVDAHPSAQPDMGTVHRPIATSWGCELYQRFVRRKPDGIWRCAAHIGPKWEVAVALGAGIDCARVSSLVVSRRQELALTPGLHPAVAQQMAETIVATVRLALAHNFTASAACLMGMLSHPTITTEECQALAAHPNMSPPGLRRLSHNHNTGVRLAVAHNPHASARTLHRLARDGHVDVAQAAKQNLWGRA